MNKYIGHQSQISGVDEVILAKAGGEAVSDKTDGQFHDASNDAIAAMKADVKKAMRVFCN